MITSKPRYVLLTAEFILFGRNCGPKAKFFEPKPTSTSGVRQDG